MALSASSERARRDAMRDMAEDAITQHNPDDWLLCVVCETEKPVSQFFRPGQPLRGYRSRCVECRDAEEARRIEGHKREEERQRRLAGGLQRLADAKAERARLIAEGAHPLVLDGWKVYGVNA